MTTDRELELIEMIGVQTRLNAEEEQALLKVLREAKTLASGPEGEAFEKEFAAFAGSADAVCLCNCSSALELSAILSGIGPGDEVIIPAHTFVSTAVPFGRSLGVVEFGPVDATLTTRDGRVFRVSAKRQHFQRLLYPERLLEAIRGLESGDSGGSNP